VLVAPSIPGHVIPAPSPIDVSQVDAQAVAAGAPMGLMAALSNGLKTSPGNGGQGAPYVDSEGYWRDYGTKALYQFHDPNTGAPMGRPGYMPNRFQSFMQQQQASIAAADAMATSSGAPDQTAADAATAVRSGLQVAGTAAAVAAAATGSSAAATAATVAGVAGSIAACLGPLPVAPLEGWAELEGKICRAYDGDRSLQLTIVPAPDGSGWMVLAVEVAAAAAMLLEDDAIGGARALYADHAHGMVGVSETESEAAESAEGYARQWRARRQREREARHATGHANACGCEGIEAR
jgi:hypothetical protein